MTAFPTPRDTDADGPRLRATDKRPGRRRPPADPGKSKQSTEPAEPGDEGNEVSWMAGLSNRLSAYSLSEDEAQAAESSDDEASDDSRPTRTSSTPTTSADLPHRALRSSPR